MILLLFLSISNVVAHMPVFGENLHIDDTQTKSWGVYILLEDTYSLTMNVPKGKNISFSLSVPGWYKEQPNITVELSGHDAKNISCDPEFNGWGTRPEWEGSGRLGDMIPVYKTSKNVFEPFGVGAYRPVAACQGKTAGGTFKLNITNNDLTKLRISIGVGMEESFSVEELLFMSYTILQSWLWAGNWWLLVVPIVGLVMWIGFILYNSSIYCTSSYKFVGQEIIFIKTGLKLLQQSIGLLCGLFMVVNALQFTIQLIYTAFYVPVEPAFPLSVHIILPLVACLVFYKYTETEFGEIPNKCTCCCDCCKYGSHCLFGVLFAAYTFALLWQGYCIPFFSFVVYFVLRLILFYTY